MRYLLRLCVYVCVCARASVRACARLCASVKKGGMLKRALYWQIIIIITMSSSLSSSKPWPMRRGASRVGQGQAAGPCGSGRWGRRAGANPRAGTHGQVGNCCRGGWQSQICGPVGCQCKRQTPGGQSGWAGCRRGIWVRHR